VQVTEIWRYPVKSLQGEAVDHAEVTRHGIVGDRQWGLVDLETGFVLTCRREPRLLHACGRLDGDGGVLIDLPDGRTTTSDTELSDWLGRRVELWRPSTRGRAVYETPLGVEEDGRWFTWEGPEGTFHDSTRTMVSLTTTASLRSWDRRRFRMNVILEGEGEDDLVGGQVRVGDVVLDVRKQVDRCIVVTRPQPGGIDRDLDVLKTINREREGFLGIGALVATPGRVAVGDELVPA
jgi:uncharacterized protein YcbX